MRLLTIAAAVALTACQTDPRHIADGRPPPVDAPDCVGQGAGHNNNDDCKILVDVEPAGAGCKITVAAGQDVVVFAQAAKKKWILWRIRAGAGHYKFTAHGIEFKDDDPHAPNFDKGKAVHDGAVYRWRNRNEKAGGGTYEYGIEVRNTATNVPCGFDPVIKNQA